MPYRDTWSTCEKCGKEFVFTVEQQRRLEGGGQEVVAPSQCHRCQGEVEVTAGPHTGTVKWYDPEKGYGFVAHGPGKDIFFHRTGIAEGENPLFDDGTPVTYVIEESEKGPHAINVARVGAVAASKEEPTEEGA